MFRKVMIVLEELGLHYEPVYLNLSANESKEEKHTKYNPNGRIPTLIDHVFAIWCVPHSDATPLGDASKGTVGELNCVSCGESGAIISYVTEKYDRTRKISFEKFEDKMQLLQWLFFQASGQGEDPSAIIGYQEIIRVLGVLESVLSQHRWLVGEKYSVADVSFITWNHAAFACLVKDYDGFDLEKDFPSVHRWHNEMLGRPAVDKVFAMWQAW
ncbi:glutathione S-transferase C-terminal-like protein [Lentinus tigrinus ALCF2SS1-6]|uniref:Glutathione S-transferase C-terminal-like protein n=1 Tax=Lentinus tigrinus ALCF2SS1-6 TaxID=1328759 RepID=A0A5C2SJG4_9APHY|nr:glutathione S-transferase C-terminal-like protein [Lentinus tigrinus ALCF2SS1-6]